MDLPDELALPLTSGAAWWYWLGGRPAFDFVNTMRERWWRNVETLVTASDLTAWLGEADLLELPVAASDRQLRSARRLREAIDTGILAATGGAPAPAAAVTEINRWLARAQSHPQLIDEDGLLTLGTLTPHDPVEHALHLIAHDAASVLAASGPSRARVCASDTCSARFYDSSRAGTRRWCSMNACGNTAKARRHRARTSGG